MANNTPLPITNEILMKRYLTFILFTILLTQQLSLAKQKPQLREEQQKEEESYWEMAKSIATSPASIALAAAYIGYSLGYGDAEYSHNKKPTFKDGFRQGEVNGYTRGYTDGLNIGNTTCFTTDTLSCESRLQLAERSFATQLEIETENIFDEGFRQGLRSHLF